MTVMQPLLDRVRANSDEVGECWEWRGALTRGVTPTIRYKYQGKWATMPVRRALLLDKGIKIMPNMRAMTKCNNPRCVNPDHVVQQTTRTMIKQRIVSVTTGMRGLARATKIANARRAKSRLTMEDVRHIRASNDSPLTLATRYGVSKKHINGIRAGATWREYTNPWIGLVA